MQFRKQLQVWEIVRSDAQRSDSLQYPRQRTAKEAASSESVKPLARAMETVVTLETAARSVNSLRLLSGEEVNRMESKKIFTNTYRKPILRTNVSEKWDCFIELHFSNKCRFKNAI